MSTTHAKPQTKLVRPLRGGQMTIPAEFRKSLGINEETMLRVTLADGELRITPVKVEEPRRSSDALRELYEYFAPTRAAILASGITQEELLAEIKAAVAEVRAEQRAQRG
jgi:AbrB family looped-hinge helix DNA binding protein